MAKSGTLFAVGLLAVAAAAYAFVKIRKGKVTVKLSQVGPYYVGGAYTSEVSVTNNTGEDMPLEVALRIGDRIFVPELGIWVDEAGHTWEGEIGAKKEVTLDMPWTPLRSGAHKVRVTVTDLSVGHVGQVLADISYPNISVA